MSPPEHRLANEPATFEAWTSRGARVPVKVPSTGHAHHVFELVDGVEGPWTTFFHGFPTCSWDWGPVAARLPATRRRLFIDHLGFGNSDKPTDHRYSFDEQIELACGVWDRHDVDSTVLVVHDYSVSMAQEILARHEGGIWEGPSITGVMFLNGGLFHSVQTPLPIQRVLRAPVLGALAGRLVNRALFDRSMRRIWSDRHPVTELELAQHWDAVQRRDGTRVVHLVSQYHDERRRNEAVWTDAIADTDVPLRFVWGALDPVSGAPMVQRVRALRRDAEVVEWDDVGHYPQIEVPDRVARLVLEMESLYG